MARGLYIRLPDDRQDALFEVADHNWRRPRDQAALYILEGLRRDANAAEQAEPDRAAEPAVKRA